MTLRLGRAPPPPPGSLKWQCPTVNHPASPAPTLATLSLVNLPQVDPWTLSAMLQALEGLPSVSYPVLAPSTTTPRNLELGHAVTLDLCECSAHHLGILRKLAIPMGQEELSPGITIPDTRSSQPFSASLSFHPAVLDNGVSLQFRAWKQATGCPWAD